MKKLHRARHISAPSLSQRSSRIKSIAWLITLCTLLAVTLMPAFAAPDTSQLSETIGYIQTVAVVIGGGVTIFGLVRIGIKWQMGGREAVQSAKFDIGCLIVGAICIFGSTGVANLIKSMNGFS